MAGFCFIFSFFVYGKPCKSTYMHSIVPHWSHDQLWTRINVFKFEHFEKLRNLFQIPFFSASVNDRLFKQHSIFRAMLFESKVGYIRAYCGYVIILIWFILLEGFVVWCLLRNQTNFDVGGPFDFFKHSRQFTDLYEGRQRWSDNCIWLKKKEYKKTVIMHRKQSLLIAEALGKFIKGVIDQPIRAIWKNTG